MRFSNEVINPFHRQWVVFILLQNNLKSVRAIVAGSIIGALEVSIIYPAEYVKTQLQLQHTAFVTQYKREMYKGMLDCARKTYYFYGFLGFYHGASILFFGTPPKVAVRFGAFEASKSRFVDENNSLSLKHTVLCACGACALEAFLIAVPLEALKVRYISDKTLRKRRFDSVTHCMSLIYKEEGFKAFYKGWLPTVMKLTSSQGFRCVLIDESRKIHNKFEPDSSKGLYHLITAGIALFAATVTVAINMPLDVVKTRMQGHDGAHYTSFWDCVVKTYRSGGIRTFYKGIIPRLIHVGIDVSCTFLLYDFVMDFVDKNWPTF